MSDFDPFFLDKVSLIERFNYWFPSLKLSIEFTVACFFISLNVKHDHSNIFGYTTFGYSPHG